MEKKRSVGVTIFGYVGLIGALLGMTENLLKIPNANLVSMFICFFYIFLNYKLLKLKNWSRVLLLITNGISAFFITIAIVITLFGLPAKEITEGFKKSYPNDTIFGFILFLIANIYVYGFIFFFLRPKVKEQFK